MSDGLSVKASLRATGAVLASLWIVHALGYVFPMLSYGIKPREWTGLAGILFAPFLHSGLPHIIANTSALGVLLITILLLESHKAWLVILEIALLGGIGTWLIGGSGTVHVGASGVIFGLLGYLMAVGVVRRDLKSLLASVVIIATYGGALWGLLPGMPGISWEGHVSGFAAGLLAAKFSGKTASSREEAG